MWAPKVAELVRTGLNLAGALLEFNKMPELRHKLINVPHTGLDVATVEKHLNVYVVASANAPLATAMATLPLLVRKGSLTVQFLGARGQTPCPSQIWLAGSPH